VTDAKDHPAFEAFPDKLSWYEPTERATARLQTHLRKPSEPDDLTGLLRDQANRSAP
jgi:hypothetical protein